METKIEIKGVIIGQKEYDELVEIKTKFNNALIPLVKTSVGVVWYANVPDFDKRITEAFQEYEQTINKLQEELTIIRKSWWYKRFYKK